MDVATFVGSIVAALGGGGAAGSVITRLYSRKRQSDERRDDILVRMLEREQTAHAETRDRERQAMQAGVQPQVDLAEVKAQLDSVTDRLAEVVQRGEDCDKRNAELTRRVFRLENRLTPANGTPAIREETGPRPTVRETTQRGMLLPPPIMSESVGGHER